MQNDDHPSGYVLTRREAVALLAAAGCSLLTGRSPASGQPPRATHPACVVRPEQTEGPFFVDERLNRSDLRTEPANGKVTPGVPLDLTLAVSRLTGGGCTPMVGVLVDVWHCDHRGVYSDDNLLRGYQMTDARGRARFKTIYPGWYHGRTVHIHFKLHSAPTVRPGFDFTSQLYFDDTLTDRVYAQAPYAARGARPVRNNRDGIYRQGGSQLLLSLAPSGPGFAGTFEVALQGT